MRYGTLLAGAVFTAASGILIAATATEPALAVNDMISPKRITYLFLGLLGLFGMLLMLSGLRELKAGTRRAGGEKHGGLRLAVFMGLCVLYAWGLSFAGCFPAWTAALLFASMLLLRVRPLRSALIALAFSLTVFLVFKNLLGVPLP